MTIIFLLLVISMLLVFLAHRIYYANYWMMQNPKLLRPRSSDSTIIAFDLHGVMFKPRYGRCIKLIWSNKKAWLAAPFFLNPYLIRDLFRFWQKDIVPEKFIERITVNYKHLKPLIPLIIDIANAQQPIPETIALIKNLKEGGYGIHLVSNISGHLLHTLVTQFPDAFRYFDAVVIPKEENNYLAKSNPLFFTNYQTDYAQYQIILVDNNRKNIKAAQSVGIFCLYFTSAHTLQENLAALGIKQY